jgi:hypothetical protein
MKKFIGILLLSIGLVGFSNSELKSNERLSTDIQFKIPNEIDTTGAKQFWDALSTYCGKTFEGEIISAPAGDDFRDKRLVMHVLSCSTDKILIPFNVGDDRSRTWVLTYTNGTIELKHDHRHADGKQLLRSRCLCVSRDIFRASSFQSSFDRRFISFPALFLKV